MRRLFFLAEPLGWVGVLVAMNEGLQYYSVSPHPSASLPPSPQEKAWFDTPNGVNASPLCHPEWSEAESKSERSEDRIVLCTIRDLLCSELQTSIVDPDALHRPTGSTKKTFR